MADVKISGLPASTTPLGGTEVLPIVQGTTTKKVSVSDLTAGRAVSATQYTSTIATGTAPLVVASTTEVANLRAANATSADTANQVKSNATTGVLQVTGPAAGTTRVMTTPNANFTAARTDAGQTFTGDQSVTGDLTLSTAGKGYYFFSTNKKYFLYGDGADNLRFVRYNSGGSFEDVPFEIDVTSNVKIPTGNLVIGTSGKGIDFSATAGTGTSELLSDYEEGTWTPRDSGGNSIGSGTYTKVGRLVTLVALIENNSVSTQYIGNIPFSATTNYYGGFFTRALRSNTFSNNFSCRIIVAQTSTTTIDFVTNVSSGADAAFTLTTEASGTVRVGLVVTYIA